ncbi:MAG: hypothetical protein AVDCRST_MAG12-3616, partial [uncultured Rubrobacteraceae bacterium]
AVRALRRARGLCHAGVRVGDALPGSGQLRAVLRVLLGVGAVRDRRAPGDGRVQDEPAQETPGAGSPLDPPVHRRAAHRYAGAERRSLLRSV